ncbi:V-type ATPase subunit [uncultured Thiodictyon sp.]|uniref:V0D/AC39 family V-type ATPase subunit n=1 Tax=uncultured Thiodictyon sp. TaxID=1846217 RepID=UPI0025FCB098|nr:V-type ATPase subunit [uncultured Thiodictyon sp.]
MRPAAHAYLNTRVSVMATRLFDPDTIGRLSQMPLPELAERFGLAPLLDEHQSAKSRGRAIEQTLIQLLLAELQVLVRPMNAMERSLVLAWGRKYALFNLKTLIRGKLYDLDQQVIRDSLFDLQSFIRLPDEEMLRAENVLELLRQLEAGPLRLIARQAREIYEQRREPFALEAAIDQRYYLGLARQLTQFHDASRHPLQQLIGAELDRMALLWLLRFRFSYQLSPSETFYQLIPSMRLMHRERLLALVNIETFAAVLAALPPPLDTLSVDCRTVIDVQRHMGRYVAREATALLRHSASGVTRALAYLMRRESDLFLLFALIQGRLLNLSTEVVDIALEITEPTCPWSGSRAGTVVARKLK